MKPIHKMKSYKCVQCQNDMPTRILGELNEVSFCENPECPNYGLFQIGIEYFEAVKRVKEDLKKKTSH